MPYLLVLGRIVTVIPLFLIVALIMGKRHVGELSVFDFVIAVTLGAVAGADLADPEVPHGPTVVTILLLALAHFLLSRLILRNRRAGRLLTLDPTVVIQNGVIIRSNLNRIRYSIDELMGHLREQGVFNIEEVEFAVLESSGVLSVLKKTQHQPVTPSDLKLPTTYQGLATPVILEGKVNTRALDQTGLSRQWLSDQLTRRGYTVDQVFIGLLSTTGDLYLSLMEHPPALRLDH